MQGNTSNSIEANKASEDSFLRTESSEAVLLKKNNKKYWIVITILAIIATGLIIAIIVINTIRSNVSLTQDSLLEKYLPAEYNNEYMSVPSKTYEAARNILEINPLDGYEIAMKLFDQQLDIADSPEAELNIEYARITFLIDYEYYDEALSFLSSIDLGEMDDENILAVYLFYSQVYKKLGNEDKRFEYDNLAQPLMNKLEEGM